MNTTPRPAPCLCIGPQNGQPVCPCRMKEITIVNGRYVQTIDHGPAPEQSQSLPTDAGGYWS